MAAKVESWQTGFANDLREPILIIRTTDGVEHVFMMPGPTAAEMAQGLLAEAERAHPQGKPS